jgi:glycosyltransferase involved in cell wall biosynthesis
MRIALVNKYWYLKGGSEQVLFDTKELLEKHGHEVSCFGMQHVENIVSNDFFVPHIEYGKLRGVEKLTAGLNSIYNRRVRRAFGLFIDHYQPEVIHVHNIYHQLSFSILDEARARGIPVVMTLHDYKMMSPSYTMFHHGKNDMSMVGGKYYRCVRTNCTENWGESVVVTLEAYFRKWKKYADTISHYIAPSEWMREVYLRAGMDDTKISVIPNPVSASPHEVRATDEGYVLYFGRFSKEKGVRILLDVAEKTPNIKYRLVGEGPEQDELKKYCREKKISNVTFFPFQTGEVLARTIRQARLSVLPSIWYENAPMSVLRSIMEGRVVVASAIGGIPELLPDSLCVPAGDVDALREKIVAWYSASSSDREKMVREIQKTLDARHAPEQYYASLMKCYEHV